MRFVKIAKHSGPVWPVSAASGGSSSEAVRSASASFTSDRASNVSIERAFSRPKNAWYAVNSVACRAASPTSLR